MIINDNSIQFILYSPSYIASFQKKKKKSKRGKNPETEPPGKDSGKENLPIKKKKP